MSSVAQIESAISQLPPGELRRLGAWFDELRAEVFADAIAADADAGRLDFLFDEAEAESKEAPLKPWPPRD